MVFTQRSYSLGSVLPRRRIFLRSSVAGRSKRMLPPQQMRRLLPSFYFAAQELSTLTLELSQAFSIDEEPSEELLGLDFVDEQP